MAVDDPSVVDAISLEPSSGATVLTVSDHYDWVDSQEHLTILQAKLNKYLAFIESGEVYESYPDAVGREIHIRVVFRCPPDAAGVEFLTQAQATIKNAGFSFGWEVLQDD